MRRTIVLVLGSALISSLIVLAFQRFDGLWTGVDGSVGESVSPGVPTARAGETYSMVIEQLCVRGDHTATITAVRPIAMSAGLTITDFAITAPASSRGAERMRLQEYVDTMPFGTTGPRTRRLVARCADGGSPFAAQPLAIQVEVDGPLPAGIAGIAVDYRIQGITRTIEFSNGAGFCRGDETPADDEDLITRLGLNELDEKLSVYPCAS